MKKFNVSYTELVYYLTQKIEAKDLYDCKIEEIKENE